MGRNEFESLDRFSKLFIFGFMSSLVLGITIFIFVAFHDYLFVTVYNIISNMVTASQISATWLTVWEGAITNFNLIIGAIDYLWALSFIYIVISMWTTSYKAKREGYYSIIGFLTFGVLIFLFVGSIFETITHYIYDIFFNAILVNLPVSLTFFDLYIQNFALVNLIIVVIAVVMNFVDFDLANFFSRKDKENLESVRRETRQSEL